MTADVLYAADYTKRRTGYDFISHHTLDNVVHDVEQYNTGLRRKLTHNVRTSLEYRITENDHLNMAYTAAITPSLRTVETRRASCRNRPTSGKETSRCTTLPSTIQHVGE